MLFIPVKPVQRLMVIHLPGLCHEASWSPWHLPLTSSYIVLWSTSHHMLVPALAIWPCLSQWPRPHCFPAPLSVSKWLLGTKTSCHNRLWIIATNLSLFMTHAHINNQLLTQQTTLYSHTACHQLTESHQISQGS